jgi:hypothetical protein
MTVQGVPWTSQVFVKLRGCSGDDADTGMASARANATAASVAAGVILVMSAPFFCSVGPTGIREDASVGAMAHRKEPFGLPLRREVIWLARTSLRLNPHK